MKMRYEVQEVSKPASNEFRHIKPQEGMTKREADSYWQTRVEAREKQYTDDNGKAYREGDRLLPNNEYKVNDYTYKTDDKERIVSAEGNVRITDEIKTRNTTDTSKLADKREGDNAGHLIARIFGGSDRLENLVPMDAKLNSGDYRKMENTLSNAAKNGADVRLKVEPVYKGDSARPDRIRVTYTINGEKEIRVFRNESEAKA